MSLNLDDWLKPDEAPDPNPTPVVDDDDPIANSLSTADLQLPDLGLPDIKWWVDLEFLDLASGPPANINSGQEKNKNKHNPTLGYHFPDIFFDTTGGLGSTSSNLFGSVDDTHRSLINDQAFENFEKGLLADLFPSTSTGNEDKLLDDDFAEINNATGDNNVISASTINEGVKDVVDKADVDQVLDNGELATIIGPEKNDDEPSYAVPIEVLQTISKNFEKLQADFEKTTEPLEPSRVIRIKSIRTVPPEANIEEVVRPEGTVATIGIQTNKANNTTTFTILPSIGASPGLGQSFLVKTNNLSQATKMIKPLHLDQLPVFKNLFHNIKVVPPTYSGNCNKGASKSSAMKENVINESAASLTIEKRSPKNSESFESDFLAELAEFGVFYDKIKVAKNEDNKLIWFCPEENCSSDFPKKCRLKLHIFSHKGVKPFKCDREGCKWSFPTMVRLKRHLEAHTNAKPFKCNLPGCEDKSFTTVYNLNTHIKQHAKDGQFNCPMCDKTFRCQRFLDLHSKNEHSEDFAPSYSCHHPGCGRIYYTKTDLGKHLKNHGVITDESRLICSACQKPFKTASLLRNHERIHTGQRPFACTAPGCKWAFRTSSKLRRHERSHKNDRRYSCEVCEKSYLRLEHLRDHVEVAHKNQKLACPFDKCDSRFTQRPSLIAHIKKHQEDPNGQSHHQQRFRCVIEKCGKKFQSRRNLSHHITKGHRMEPSAQAVQDQSEVDLIALLSCVAEEDLKVDSNPSELITVDASAITPLKSSDGPNIISKSRKRRRQTSILQNSKRMSKEGQTVAQSTINMQDLV